MSKDLCRSMFSIVDAMVENAVSEVKAEGDEVSCLKGCSYCCHLLVEISWEEAQKIAEVIASLPEEEQGWCIKKVLENAENARQLFAERYTTLKFCEPYSGEMSFPDEVYDRYFYQIKQSCPFLREGRCSVYSVRPSACRLHLVSSCPSLCSPEIPDHDDYNIPERFEKLKEEVAPVLAAIEKDGRWGQMAIMVEAALREFLRYRMRYGGNKPKRAASSSTPRIFLP